MMACATLPSELNSKFETIATTAIPALSSDNCARYLINKCMTKYLSQKGSFGLNEFAERFDIFNDFPSFSTLDEYAGKYLEHPSASLEEVLEGYRLQNTVNTTATPSSSVTGTEDAKAPHQSAIDHQSRLIQSLNTEVLRLLQIQDDHRQELTRLSNEVQSNESRFKSEQERHGVEIAALRDEMQSNGAKLKLEHEQQLAALQTAMQAQFQLEREQLKQINESTQKGLDEAKF
jgi:hypothetical protein